MVFFILLLIFGGFFSLPHDPTFPSHLRWKMWKMRRKRGIMPKGKGKPHLGASSCISHPPLFVPFPPCLCSQNKQKQQTNHLFGSLSFSVSVFRPWLFNFPHFKKERWKKKGFFDLVFIAYHDSSADHPARYERHIALSRIIQEGKIHFFKKRPPPCSEACMIVKRRRWLNYFE